MEWSMIYVFQRLRVSATTPRVEAWLPTQPSREQGRDSSDEKEDVRKFPKVNFTDDFPKDLFQNEGSQKVSFLDR